MVAVHAHAGKRHMACAAPLSLETLVTGVYKEPCPACWAPIHLVVHSSFGSLGSIEGNESSAVLVLGHHNATC